MSNFDTQKTYNVCKIKNYVNNVNFKDVNVNKVNSLITSLITPLTQSPGISVDLVGPQKIISPNIRH